MFDDRVKGGKLVLPPLDHGPECDRYTNDLEEQLAELRATEKTRSILDLIQRDRHQQALEAARLEGWNAARLGVEIESDLSAIDCGELPIHTVKFQYETYDSWRDSRKSDKKS